MCTHTHTIFAKGLDQTLALPFPRNQKPCLLHWPPGFTPHGAPAERLWVTLPTHTVQWAFIDSWSWACREDKASCSHLTGHKVKWRNHPATWTKGRSLRCSEVQVPLRDVQGPLRDDRGKGRGSCSWDVAEEVASVSSFDSPGEGSPGKFQMPGKKLRMAGVQPTSP